MQKALSESFLHLTGGRSHPLRRARSYTRAQACAPAAHCAAGVQAFLYKPTRSALPRGAGKIPRQNLISFPHALFPQNIKFYLIFIQIYFYNTHIIYNIKISSVYNKDGQKA